MAEPQGDLTMRMPISDGGINTEIAALTDIGRKRDHNEDNLVVLQLEEAAEAGCKGVLCAVADGMGGHASGDVASRIAIETLREYYCKDQSADVGESLLAAYHQANRTIYEQSDHQTVRSRMGTTLVSAVLHDDKLFIANVGDSRAYVIDDGFIRQVSQDHSWVAEQVRRGELSQAEAEQHPLRNLVTRSLGVAPEVEVDIFKEPLRPGSAVLLCSDGLSGLVSASEMLEVVLAEKPQNAVRRLVDLANERGGPDNITVIVVKISEPAK